MNALGKPCKTEKELRTALLELAERNANAERQLLAMSNAPTFSEAQVIALRAIAEMVGTGAKLARVSAGEVKK